MNVIRKDAKIENTGADDDFPGSFEVILSTPEQDRDGDELKSEDWEQPLPDHITFDQDHGMNVASTVGSGVPAINSDGNLVVTGTYSSLARAQEVRTLVREGHIRTTSVAFMTKTVTKAGGQRRTVRELLNGAFVAIPSNRGALVTASKSVKAGARNSRDDQAHIQAIHDAAVALGAIPADADDETKSVETAGAPSIGVKTVGGSYEQRQEALRDALDAAYPSPDDDTWVYAYPLATFDSSVVFRVSGNTDARGQWQASYTVAEDGTITLGDAERVTMVETVVPVSGSVPKGFRLVPDAPAHVGKSAAAADSTSAQDAADETAAAASEDAAAAAESAATEADASEIQVRAARIRVLAGLIEL